MPGPDRARLRARTGPPGRFPGRAGRPPRRSIAGRLVVAGVIAGLVAGGVSYLGMEKRVTLVVDGQARQILTFGDTVGDVLDLAQVGVGAHDRVQPPVAAALADGMRIDVLLAKEVVLVLDGTRRTVRVTGGKTVEDVLEKVNLPTTRHAYVRPSPAAPVEDGDVIVYRAAKAVEVTADGETLSVITNAPDVGYLLDSMGIILRGRDVVRPAGRTEIRPDLRIRVMRIGVRRVVEDQAVPFDTEVRYSDEMTEGQERVEREGVEGLVRKVFRIRFEDGAEAQRTLLHSDVLREPVSRIVVRGNRPPSAQEGIASWYERDGMVAAHPSLPFGTEVHVTNVANGRSVSVVINDRGPYVEGRIIDLSDDAFAQLAPLSSGTCRVRITW